MFVVSPGQVLTDVNLQNLKLLTVSTVVEGDGGGHVLLPAVAFGFLEC